MRILLAAALLVQATTFDIATFTVPAGWQRLDQNGTVQFQTTRTVGRRTVYCQIFLFPSRPGSTNALQNFGAEWTKLIARPFGMVVTRPPETRQFSDGWTALTNSVNVLQRGIPVTAILLTVTGHGRVMSVVTNESAQDYTAERIEDVCCARDEGP